MAGRGELPERGQGHARVLVDAENSIWRPEGESGGEVLGAPRRRGL